MRWWARLRSAMWKRVPGPRRLRSSHCRGRPLGPGSVTEGSGLFCSELSLVRQRRFRGHGRTKPRTESRGRSVPAKSQIAVETSAYGTPNVSMLYYNKEVRYPVFRCRWARSSEAAAPLVVAKLCCFRPDNLPYNLPGNAEVSAYRLDRLTVDEVGATDLRDHPENGVLIHAETHLSAISPHGRPDKAKQTEPCEKYGAPRCLFA
jgi:hypothetical protein